MEAGSSKAVFQTCEIDPEGDLYLEVGTLLLLVSSKILSLASPVFDKMLNSRFKEGLINQQDWGKPRIVLPADDEKGIELVCRILHYCRSQMPPKISDVLLYSVALVCDKYDCVSALQAWATVRLQDEGLLEPCDANISNLLVAAYIFDLPEQFSHISWSILLKHAGNFKNLEVDEDHIPENFASRYLRD